MKIKEYKIIQDELKHPKLWETHEYNYKENDLKSCDKIVNMLNECFKLNKVVDEHSYVLAYTASLDFLGICELGHGDSLNAPSNFKGLFKFLLLVNADRFVVVHNHPDGNSDPSEEDKSTTKKIINISEMMNFILDESIVVGKNKCSLIKNIIDKEMVNSLPKF